MRIPTRIAITLTHSASAASNHNRSCYSTCRAVLVPSFGGPEVLQLHPNVQVPPLKPNEVLVRSRAVSINPLDTRMRSGYGRSLFEPLLPIILGRDVSGEVAAVGASVRSVSIGQEVFGALHPTAVRGTYTDYAILPEDEITPKPSSLSHVDVEVAIKGKFDAVLDTIGVPETERMGINFLKQGGHYMTLQGEAASLADRFGLAVGLPAAKVAELQKQIRYRYSHGIDYSWTYMRADIEGLIEIRKLCEAGKLKIPVDKTYPITQVREAHEAKDKKLIPGKVVLELD
ncbi:Reticulon-4-interacting protein 1 [Arachis hypogaea]|nr:Reticulon-4-interacting protein 1 [Arachis hypogaea]